MLINLALDGNVYVANPVVHHDMICGMLPSVLSPVATSVAVSAQGLPVFAGAFPRPLQLPPAYNGSLGDDTPCAYCGSIGATYIPDAYTGPMCDPCLDFMIAGGENSDS